MFNFDSMRAPGTGAGPSVDDSQAGAEIYVSNCDRRLPLLDATGHQVLLVLRAGRFHQAMLP
jgi:hypothetical protein